MDTFAGSADRSLAGLRAPIVIARMHSYLKHWVVWSYGASFRFDARTGKLTCILGVQGVWRGRGLRGQGKRSARICRCERVKGVK